MQRTFLCVGNGDGRHWEAMCLDLDISVAGRDFDDVKQSLETAIAMYVASAEREEPSVREKLLNRRAPAWVRFKAVTRIFLMLIFAKASNKGRGEAAFSLPCPV